MRNIKKEVEEIICSISGVKEIQEEDLLKEELGIDSLALVEVVAELEDRFSIRFDMGELDPDRLLSVADLIALVETVL